MLPKIGIMEELVVGTLTPGEVVGIYNKENRGPDLVPAFVSGLTGWTGSNWAYEATGKARHATGSNDPLVSGITVQKDRVYRISWTVTGATAGTIYASIGGWATTPVFPHTGYSGWGDHLIMWNDEPLTFHPSSDFDGAITSVELKEVPSIASIDSAQHGLYIFSDSANDQRILTTKGLWVGSFHPMPISFNMPPGNIHKGVYIDEYANLTIKTFNPLSYALAVGGNALIEKGESTGEIMRITGAEGDSYGFGFDAAGGYFGMVAAKPFRWYAGTSGYMEQSAVGDLLLKRGASLGTIFTLEGATGDLVYHGFDATGPYIAPGIAKPFRIYGGTSGYLELTAVSDATLSGSLTSSSFIQATEFRTGGTSIYNLAHTWGADQAFGGDIKIVRGTGTPWLHIVNTNTGNTTVFSMAEVDDGTTPFWIERFGSTHAQSNEVVIRNAMDAPITMRTGNSSFSWHNNGATRMILSPNGSLTLGSVAETGTGNFFAGGATFTGGVDANTYTGTWNGDAIDASKLGSHSHTKADISDFAHGHDASELTGVVTWKGSLSSPPSDPVEGWMYYDVVAGEIKVYTSGAWKP